jgi:predicted RNase H-like HicB family nuclease
MKRSFILEYWMDDGWYVGRMRDVPGVFSQGETLKELKENILDAYNLMMQDERVDIQGKSKQVAI